MAAPTAPTAPTADVRPTPEEAQAAARRLTPLLTEDGDWLVEPESAQFHEDIATLIRAVGVQPVKRSY